MDDVSQWWSWLLMSIGVGGQYLTGRRLAIGWAVGLGAQVLWLAYSISTGQWGFLVSCFFYGGMAAYNLRKWRKSTPASPARHEFDDDDIRVLAAGLAHRYGTPYDDDHEVRAVGLLAEVMTARYQRDVPQAVR